MRILVLDQFSEPGGAQLCLRDLMPEFLSRGWEPVLMAPGDGALMEWSRGLGIPAFPLPMGEYSNGRKSARDCLRYSIDAPRMALAVRQTVRRKRVDLVYVNGPRALPAVLGVACPVVFHAHSRIRGWRERHLVRWILRSANATIIAASGYVAAGLELQKVIYNGVADLGEGSRTFERRAARVGIVGRIAPEKGHLDFVRAARTLKESGSDAEFFVYGERLFARHTYEAQVRSEAGNAVTFRGWTNDVGHALRNLEMLAVPSGTDEAATRVIMEAFSAGTPVVAYRSGGIPELVEHGRTGLLTSAGSLCQTVDGLLRDRERMHLFSAAGRREWEQRFRVGQFRSRVCDLLERCAQNASGLRHEAWAQAPSDGETAVSR